MNHSYWWTTCGKCGLSRGLTKIFRLSRFEFGWGVQTKMFQSWFFQILLWSRFMFAWGAETNVFFRDASRRSLNLSFIIKIFRLSRFMFGYSIQAIHSASLAWNSDFKLDLTIFRLSCCSFNFCKNSRQTSCINVVPKKKAMWLRDSQKIMMIKLKLKLPREARRTFSFEFVIQT